MNDKMKEFFKINRGIREKGGKVNIYSAIR